MAMTMTATDAQFLGGSNSARSSRLECSTITTRCSIPSRKSLRDSQRTEPNLLTGAYSPMANRFIVVAPNSCNSSSKGAAAAALEAVASSGSSTVEDQPHNRGHFLLLSTAATKPTDLSTTTAAVRIAESTAEDNNDENSEVCGRVQVDEKNLGLPVCSPGQSHQQVQPTTSGHAQIEAPSCAVQTPVERELQQQQRKGTEARSVVVKPSAACLFQSSNKDDNDATLMATSGYPAADDDMDATAASHDEHPSLHDRKGMAGNGTRDKITRSATPPVRRHQNNYDFAREGESGSDQQRGEVQHQHRHEPQQRRHQSSDSCSSAQTSSTCDATAKKHARKNVTFCLVLEVYLIPQAKEYSKSEARAMWWSKAQLAAMRENDRARMAAAGKGGRGMATVVPLTRVHRRPVGTRALSTTARPRTSRARLVKVCPPPGVLGVGWWNGAGDMNYYS